MAKTKIDIPGTLKSEATRGLYAGAGAADLAVAAVRNYVVDVQKRIEGVQHEVASIDLKPATLREQAVTAVNVRVEAVTGEAKARRVTVEKRVAELQDLPTKVSDQIQGRIQDLIDDVDENVSAATKTYGELAKRGEGLVKRVRNQSETKEAVAGAKSTVARAKTTRTQAKKATTTAKKSASSSAGTVKRSADSTVGAAKKSAATTRKTVAKKAAPVKNSAKSTATAAKKTATAATKALDAAAEKVGTTPAGTTSSSSSS